jgi:2',3'-cyclic-nucleotide 2'-phosphodiesterase (5'-nucleotidase family)
VLGSFISTVREQGSTAGVVCSNIDVSDESTLQTRATAASTSSVSNSNGENTNANADADVDADASMVKAYHIVEVAGRKIAFVGAVSSNLAAASK